MGVDRNPRDGLFFIGDPDTRHGPAGFERVNRPVIKPRTIAETPAGPVKSQKRQEYDVGPDERSTVERFRHTETAHIQLIPL